MKKTTILMTLLLAAVFCGGAMAQDTKPTSTGVAVPGTTPVKAPAATKPAPTKAAPAGEGKTEGAEKAPAGEEGAEGEEEAPQQPGGLFGSPNMMLLLIGAFVVMMIFSSRGRKKQQQKQKDMLASLKKGDTITTIGGIKGTIVEAKENEIVLKTSDNTRMRLARWAIRSAGDDAVAEDMKKDTQEEK